MFSEEKKVFMQLYLNKIQQRT